ncbi:MAG: UTP--glucose-1-phosphate uridylyltransferase [Planctomycetaceae bacterium]
MSINLAVVPVAGLGTRLLPATKSQPKEMLPIGRKPVVQYVVEELANSGMQRLLFVTGHGKGSIEDFFDVDQPLIEFLRTRGKEDQLAALEFERNNLQYAYTRQREQLGLGHAVLCAAPFVTNEPFVVALGDSILGLHGHSRVVQRMVDLCNERDAEVVVAFEELKCREDVVHYGIAQPGIALGDDVFELTDVIEKPSPDEAPSLLAVAARYVFKPSIFDYLAKTERGKGNEIQLTDAMRALLKDRPGSGIGVRLPPGESRYDIGNFASYFRAFIDFAAADEEHGDMVREYLKTLANGRFAGG